MLKYLIAGLGNVGEEYSNTRHNVGFIVLDAFANNSNILFEKKRYAFVSKFKYRGKLLILLKPITYMNLSGKAVKYWIAKEKIPIENLLIIVDDTALPLGVLRLKPKGNNGGHNGLLSIQQELGHCNYARLRFGIGDKFSYGEQVDYVLGQWSDEEKTILTTRVEDAVNIIKCFVTVGIEKTMSLFNRRGR